MGKFLQKLQNKIREQDMFGMRVQLTYKGEKAFNSVCGGLATICMIIALLFVFFYELDSYWF